MEIDVEHFLRIKKNLNEILASNTGKTAEEVKAASERDHWMTLTRPRTSVWWIRSSLLRSKRGNTMSDESKKGLRCSFCGKHESQVHRMIQGPGVRICDECVQLCMSILNDGFEGHLFPAHWRTCLISCPRPARSRTCWTSTSSVRMRLSVCWPSRSTTTISAS